MGTRDHEAFQLPVNGFFADLEVGEGSFHMPEEFHDASLEARIKILADWQQHIAAAQHRLVQQLVQGLVPTPDRGTETSLVAMRPAPRATVVQATLPETASNDPTSD